jgi:hypothetical protein
MRCKRIWGEQDVLWGEFTAARQHACPIGMVCAASDVSWFGCYMLRPWYDNAVSNSKKKDKKQKQKAKTKKWKWCLQPLLQLVPSACCCCRWQQVRRVICVCVPTHGGV